MAGLAPDDRRGDRARGSSPDQPGTASALLEGAQPVEREHAREARNPAAAGRPRGDPRDPRERSGGQPASGIVGPDRRAAARLVAAEERDAIADDRDVAATARDHAADARDRAMVQRDAGAPYDDDEPRSGSERVARAAGARKRALARRAQAAEYRAMAAVDREVAAQDREYAARERRRALLDREALALELEREQRRRDDALRHEHDAEQLARVLRHSLSPPRLPQVVGLDAAVHCEPSAVKSGADFHDLFALTAGRAGFFLGDVRGDVPQAAAVAAVARYALRGAATRHDEPAAVLLELHTTLLAQAADGPHGCSAVYAQIDAAADAATIALAIAGRFAALIVRAGGVIEPAGARGSLLGVAPDPALQVCEVQLGAGDTIVIHRAGMLDTAIDRLPADRQRVTHTLLGAPRAGAQTLVDRLVHAVRVDRPLRDGVAIAALRRTGA